MSKKFLNLFSCLFVFVLFSFSITNFVSAEEPPIEVSFVVSGGFDSTSGVLEEFNESDIVKLQILDQSRMQTSASWPSGGYEDEKYLEFIFSPDIPSNAIIESVNVQNNFRRSTSNTLTGAKLEVWDGQSFFIYNLIVPSGTNDSDESFDLTDILNTPEKINQAKVRFLAYRQSAGSIQTSHDFIGLKVVYSLPVEEEPDPTPDPDPEECELFYEENNCIDDTESEPVDPVCENMVDDVCMDEVDDEEPVDDGDGNDEEICDEELEDCDTGEEEENPSEGDEENEEICEQDCDSGDSEGEENQDEQNEEENNAGDEEENTEETNDNQDEESVQEENSSGSENQNDNTPQVSQRRRSSGSYSSAYMMQQNLILNNSNPQIVTNIPNEAERVVALESAPATTEEINPPVVEPVRPAIQNTPVVTRQNPPVTVPADEISKEENTPIDSEEEVFQSVPLQANILEAKKESRGFFKAIGNFFKKIFSRNR
jgi:hypothetical protein